VVPSAAEFDQRPVIFLIAYVEEFIKRKSVFPAKCKVWLDVVQLTE